MLRPVGTNRCKKERPEKMAQTNIPKWGLQVERLVLCGPLQRQENKTMGHETLTRTRPGMPSGAQWRI